MSWKFVFNTDHAAHLFWGNTLESAVNFIQKTGYQFFSWNGDIYWINYDTVEAKKTLLKVEDLY